MPPVPKNADWPNDNSPVKPNRMSKPRPNRPQTRMRLIVVGVNPRCGRMNGVAMSAAAVSASTRKGRCLSIKPPPSFAADRAEQAIWPQHQHQCHSHEQHDVGITGIEHRGDADDLAGDQTADDGAGK